MYIIEISEDKVSHLADTVSKMLHYGGKAMECIEDMRRGSRMNYRDDVEPEYSRDYDYMDDRYPHDRWEDYPPYMGERRGRSAATGRYMRR